MRKLLIDFQRGQIVGAQVAAEMVTKTAKLFNVSKKKISKIMTAYANHLWSQLASVKLKPGWIKTHQQDRQTLLWIVIKCNKNVTSKMAIVFNIHTCDLVLIQTVQSGLHKADIYGRAAIWKLLVSKINGQSHIA
uniref:Uncharacterized protein n=1 Tax=Erpetoichthys calabaricus TaxID=27687 RepID=A0A8C4RN55_ERPCA